MKYRGHQLSEIFQLKLFRMALFFIPMPVDTQFAGNFMGNILKILYNSNINGISDLTDFDIRVSYFYRLHLHYWYSYILPFCDYHPCAPNIPGNTIDYFNPIPHFISICIFSKAIVTAKQKYFDYGLHGFHLKSC